MVLAARPVAASVAWLYVLIASRTLLVSLATKRHQPLMRRLGSMRTTSNQQIDQTNRSAGHQKRQWERTVKQNTRRLMRVRSSENNALAATLANVSHQEWRVSDALPQSAVPLVTVGVGPGGQPAVTLIQRQPAATLPQGQLASVGVSPSGQIVSQATYGTAQPTMPAALVLPPAVAPVAAAAPAAQSGVTTNTSQAPAAASTGSDNASSQEGHPLSFVLAIATCTSLFVVIGFYIFWAFFWKPSPDQHLKQRPKRLQSNTRRSGGQSTGHTSNSSTCGDGYERSNMPYSQKLKSSTRDRPRTSQSHRSHVPSKSSGRKEAMPPASSKDRITRDLQAAASQAVEEQEF